MLATMFVATVGGPGGFRPATAQAQMLPHLSTEGGENYPSSDHVLQQASLLPQGGVVGNGTPASCTEIAFEAALVGGGQVTFNCGPNPVSIHLTTTKLITLDTQIDGGGLITVSGGEAVRVLQVQVGARLTLANLTVHAGRATGASGGGVANFGTLTVHHSIFTYNVAAYHGGAILNYGALEVNDSTFLGNEAGINGGAIDTIGQVTVRRSTFTSNSAGFRGGAINNYLGAMTIEESTFTANSSTGYGGGLVNDGGTALIQASSVFSNTAQDVGGGVRNSGGLSIVDSTFANNQAGTRGGGIENSNSLDVVNSTLVANSAASQGGGIYNHTGAAAQALHVTLVANNTLITGGGNLENLGSFSIGYSIIINGSILNCQGAFTSLGYNMDSGTDCGLLSADDTQNEEPGLTPLQDNGGPTFTMAPLTGNVFDRIPAAACLPTDQRGLTRPQGGRCDIGAIERYTSPPLFSAANPMPWPMLGRLAGRPGLSGTAGPDDAHKLGPPWPYRAGGRVSTSPAIDYQQSIFFGALDGTLYSVDRLGSLRFTFRTGGSIQSSPALVAAGPGPGPGEFYEPPAAAALYFGSDDRQVYALSTEGALHWSLAPGSPPNTSPLRSSAVAVKSPGSSLNRIYIGSDNGKLYAVFETGLTTAMTAWEVQTGVALRSAPAIAPNGDIVYVGAGDGKLYCLDALTGAHLPGTPLAISAGPLTTPVVDTSGNIYLGAQTGGIYGFDRECRPRPYWQPGLAVGVIAAPALGRDGEVLVLAGGRLYGISVFGKVTWSQSFGRPVGAIPPIVDGAGVVYVVASDGWLFAVTHPAGSSTGAIRWAIEVAPPATPYLGFPALDGWGRIVMGAADNHLQVIDDEPAFQLLHHSDQAVAGNLDIFSLRETYGALDPARTLRLTTHPLAEIQPAYGLDSRLTTFVAKRFDPGDSFLADAVATQELNLTRPASGAPFAINSVEVEPAFTPIDDLTHISRLPDRRHYLALSTTASGDERLVFVDLMAQGTGQTRVLSFTAWASAQGVPAAIAQDLEPPDTGQSQPAFAPDGRQAAWRHCDRRNPQRGFVRLLTLAGSSSRLVQVGPEVPIEGSQPCEDFGPAFAPDSRWIAIQVGGRLQVFAVDNTGTAVINSPGPAGRTPLHPTWAPDGSAIAVGAKTAAGATDLYALSGAGYAAGSRLTASTTGDEPFYHFFKMPPPQAQALIPDRQYPGETIQVAGRGFVILHPQDNQVFFTDVTHTRWLPAEVLSGGVDPHQGLGVLTVRVPDLAGNGPVRVQTRFGLSTCCQFYVLPKPTSVLQPHSVPGAKVRVFGLGFDLSPATQYQVLFSKAGGGWVAAQAISGTVTGTQEFLVVQVPAGAAESGPIRIQNAQGGRDCPCIFTLLHPAVTLRRTTGLEAYAQQGCAGVPVQITGLDFPFDPYFGNGVNRVTLTANRPGASPVPITQPILSFQPTGADTAGFGPTSFSFPWLGATHPGGDLSMQAADANLLAASAQAPFRVPLTNIPIIFVAGTSGVSLDTPFPLAKQFPGDVEWFPWICKTCALAFAPHTPFTYVYNPGLVDPDGPRVWLGPEFVNTIALDAANFLFAGDLAFLFNRANHYLDVLAFDANGANTFTPNSSVGPGTVFRRINLAPGQSMSSYEPLFSHLLTNLGRPLNSGPNGLYSFNFDWRGDMDAQAAALSAFVDSVLARSDVTADKVVLISHSVGGPIARSYYLASPANAAKVDQLISLAGGFGGVGKPIKILAMGDTWGFGWGVGPISVGFAEWEVEKLAQNWGTAYFQGPNSDFWFEDDTSRGGAFDRRYIRDERLGVPAVGRSHTAHSTWLANTYNSTIAGRADGFFSGQNPRLGDFSSGTGPVYHHRLLSLGLDTPVGLRLFTAPSQACAAALLTGNPITIGIECAPITWREPLIADGDETVTYHGLLGKTVANDDRTYVLRNVEHLELSQRQDTHNLISSLLDGTMCSQPQAAALGFSSHTQVSERFALSPATAAGSELRDQASADHWLLRMRGTAGLRIRDGQGHYTGPSDSQPSVFELSIPGLTYNPGLSFSYASITEPGSYTFDFSGIGPAALNISLDAFDGTGQLDTLAFIGIPLQKDSHARLWVNTPAPEPLSLQMDYDGDGNFERTYPAQKLDPAESADTTPPRTTISRSPANVATLAASDNPGGAGVLHTYYSVNSRTFQVYEAPFALPPNTALITAISIDRNGNIEAPAATMVVGHPLFMPIVTQHFSFP